MLYCVQACVTRTIDGWSHFKQIPTFYLDDNVQGIKDEEYAKVIARDIINPFSEDILISLNITVVCHDEDS